MDQNSAFDLEVKENCPNGVVVYDLFHVLSNFGRKVIDRVRVDAANSLRHAPWLRKVVKSSGVSGFLCLGRLFQGQPNEAALCI